MGGCGHGTVGSPPSAVRADDGAGGFDVASEVAAEWIASVLTTGPEMLITTPVTSVSNVARIFIFGP
jgi:hypothetical protein